MLLSHMSEVFYEILETIMKKYGNVLNLRAEFLRTQRNTSEESSMEAVFQMYI